MGTSPQPFLQRHHRYRRGRIGGCAAALRSSRDARVRARVRAHVLRLAILVGRTSGKERRVPYTPPTSAYTSFFAFLRTVQPWRQPHRRGGRTCVGGHAATLHGPANAQVHVHMIAHDGVRPGGCSPGAT